MDPAAFLKACEGGEVEAVRAAVEGGQDCSGVSEGEFDCCDHDELIRASSCMLITAVSYERKA